VYTIVPFNAHCHSFVLLLHIAMISEMTIKRKKTPVLSTLGNWNKPIVILFHFVSQLVGGLIGQKPFDLISSNSSLLNSCS
jgi:hypothetical protein